MSTEPTIRAYTSDNFLMITEGDKRTMIRKSSITQVTVSRNRDVPDCVGMSPAEVRARATTATMGGTYVVWIDAGSNYWSGRLTSDEWVHVSTVLGSVTGLNLAPGPFALTEDRAREARLRELAGEV